MESDVLQDRHISFRANTVVAERLAHEARRSGCSVSEYLRAVVREKVLT